MGSIRTAVSTLDLTPVEPSAELNARLLITVASIPIWSPFTRSKPLDAPLSPRNIFPPPMTIPICTPNSWISLICAAYSAKRFSSIPYCFSPIRLSPLNFRRILLYFTIIVLNLLVTNIRISYLIIGVNVLLFVVC